MRIAYFTDTFFPQINGVSNTLDKLDKYLSKKGIGHLFLAPYYPGTERNSEYVNVKRFKSVSFPVYPECRLSIPSYPNLCKIIKGFNPDLIHLVTPFGIGLSGLRFAKENSIPLVSSFHTYFDTYLKYYKLEILEETSWKFFRWFHEHCSINFVPSKDTLAKLSNHGIKNLELWSRGIDAEVFNPQYRDPSIRLTYGAENKLMLLYVGRLAPEKDLDVLLEVIRHVNAVHPGKTCFVIAGDGPYAEEMHKYHIDNVFYTGYLRGRELSALYASCDAFICPSSTETFGNVALEAMASGLPVIASDSGGLKDNVIHYHNGFLCTPRNVQSFVKVISYLLENRECLGTLSINARKYALTKTWDSVFDKLLSDYCKSLEGGKAA